MRVLLIEMPFFRLTAPSLGLAMLEASLHRQGIDCDLLHLNLELGRRLGRERYTWIAVASPQYLLAGDLVFAPALHGRPIPPDRLAALIAGLGPFAEDGVPGWSPTSPSSPPRPPR